MPDVWVLYFLMDCETIMNEQAKLIEDDKNVYILHFLDKVCLELNAKCTCLLFAQQDLNKATS